MPDYERLFRDLEVELATTDQAKCEIMAYHRGQDHARWQIVYVAAFIVLVVLIALVVVLVGLLI